MPNRHALVIGIDTYPNFNAKPLLGCAADARLMAGLLRERFGFPEGSIRLVLDEAATRERILAELDRLTEVVGQDDVVVVHYSGHGSQITDVEGDEPDGLDETIVPTDSGRDPFENNDVRDDEIHERLVKLAERTGEITFVFDSCHSGTVVRAEAAVRWVPPDLRPAEALGLKPVANGTRGAACREASGWFPLSDRYVLLAGCGDREPAHEHRVDDATVHGALTWFLVQALEQAGDQVTWRDVFETVAAEVSGRYGAQHPQLEGRKDRLVFGSGVVTPMRYVLVDPVDATKGEVRVRAGAVHGLGVGSLLDVYPPGTARLADATPLARAELATVRATESLGTLVDGGGPIAPASRGVEVVHDHRQLRQRVAIAEDVPAGESTALAEALAASPYLEVVAAAGEWDVVVHRVPARAAAAEPVPQLASVARPVWAVTDRTGVIVLPVVSAGTAADRERLAANLVVRARCEALRRLSNPSPTSELGGAVDLVFLRRTDAGEWVEAEPGPGGIPVFHDGDFVGLEVRNLHDRDLYCYVLDLGLSHRVGQLFPEAGALEVVTKGRSARTGDRDRNRIRLSIPDGWPYDPSAAPVGVESMRLLACTAPIDVDALTHEGATRGADTPLERLLVMAGTGHGLREATRVEHDDGADWTVITRSFELRRRPA